jgi:purine-cytosine permease-like protein
MVRYACVPSLQCGVVAGAWLGLWIFFVVGAAVLMAIENPTRRSDAAVELGQPELTFIQGSSSLPPRPLPSPSTKEGK